MSAAAAKSSPLSEIISATTKHKLAEFKKFNLKAKNTYAELEKETVTGKPCIEQLRLLYNGVKNLSIAQTPFHQNLPHLELVLENLEHDPTSTPAVAQVWIDKIKAEIAKNQQRCDYFDLYSNIFEQHAAYLLETEKNIASTIEEDIVAVESKNQIAKQTTREEFESKVFNAPKLDNIDEFKTYLTALFHYEDKQHQKSFEEYQEKCTKFGDDLFKKVIRSYDVETSIKGLLQENLLSARRLSALKEIKDNEVFHAEIASVMNIMLTDIDDWCWPEEGVLVEFRRQLNGKFRAFMDEDLMSALFLQWIGNTWQEYMKSSYFSLFHGSHLWNSNKVLQELSSAGGECRTPDSPNSIMASRKILEKEYFMSQLGDCDDDASTDYGYGSKGVELKQKLLHFMVTEAKLANAITPDSPFIVARTDFEWYGPSISHDHVLALLEFLGIPLRWITFFRKFLAAPLITEAGGQVRTRARGIPISHSISVLLSESMLFPLDYQIKRETGITLLRLHDDFWLWSTSETEMLNAWKIIEKFNGLTGLKLNEEKSGSAIINLSKLDSKSSITQTPGPTPLPQGPVRWGFLVFHDDGKFHISHEMLEEHITETKSRLSAASTALAWINVYNRFIKFFLRNFGTTSYGFGREHIIEIIDGLAYINKRLFTTPTSSSLSSVDSLKIVLEKYGFDSKSMNEACAYWPLKSGGLNVFNPFIEVTFLKRMFDKDIKNKVCKSDFSDMELDDETTYKRLKAAHDKKELKESKRHTYHTITPFKTFEEYKSDRLSQFENWGDRFDVLMSMPSFGRGTYSSNYENVLEEVYGDILLEKFGTTDFLDESVIPMGMIVSDLKNAEIDWQC